MPTSDGITGHHGHDRLGHAPDLDVEVGDLEASHRLVLARAGRIRAAHVTASASPHPLIAA
jgi:hypothetical protein